MGSFRVVVVGVTVPRLATDVGRGRDGHLSRGDRPVDFVSAGAGASRDLWRVLRVGSPGLHFTFLAGAVGGGGVFEWWHFSVMGGEALTSRRDP